MRIEVIKAGIFDTIQDLGRAGYAHWGINPNGVMDWHAAQVANILVGNDQSEGLLELHFPASQFLFHQSAVIALCGADFSPAVDGVSIPRNQPVYIAAGSRLTFQRKIFGARAYLAIRHGLDIQPWLSSVSTNTRIQCGGLTGNILNAGDDLKLKRQIDEPIPAFRVSVDHVYEQPPVIRFIEGREWEWLRKSSRDILESSNIKIDVASDRMAYRLIHEPLQFDTRHELLSSAVTYGTIQGLPDGNSLILMADHQTTGGYPRIGHVITADLPRLAQYNPNQSFNFRKITLREAEKILHSMLSDLEILRMAVNYKLKSS